MFIKLFNLQEIIDRLFEQACDEKWIAVWAFDDL